MNLYVQELINRLMKMKYLATSYIVLLTLFVLNSCSRDDPQDLTYTDLKSIEIGDYRFQVPSQFKLIEGMPIDSYIGQLKGSGISLSFDFGHYSGGPDRYRPNENYAIIRDTINGHVREIIIANEELDRSTSINFYALDGYSEFIGSYLALAMGASNLSLEEQELVKKILESGEPIP